MSLFDKFFNHAGKETAVHPCDIPRGTGGDGLAEFMPDGCMMSKEKIAELLGTCPEALDEFERSYSENVLRQSPTDFFDMNAKQAVSRMEHTVHGENDLVDSLVGRITNELLAQTSVYSYDGSGETVTTFRYNGEPDTPVTMDEINEVDEALRPDLTGTMYKKVLAGSPSDMIMFYYEMWKASKNPETRQLAYNHFRQGLDILDLDPLTYGIIGTNPNSIGHWFHPLVCAVKGTSFFKIPQTMFLKVPLPLLQLTRMDYQSLSPTTLRIVDEFCRKAFSLDENREYFIKTGTYSSKFDFRNAYVHGAKEVRELGEYLLFIHYQALQMASPLCTPCIYGMSTTNEWAVREFIPDHDGNPCIYKGLPLRTEYRIFADFDTDEILGISPYWRPDVMKHRFAHMNDSDSPHQKHDYVIYLSHQKTLMGRYEANRDTVLHEFGKIVGNIDLSGQWSVDVMQDGGDFYIIDMASARNSALSDCVPEGRIKDVGENWLPEIPDRK